MRYSFLLLCLVLTVQLGGQSRFLHVDQFGYYPEAPKVAVLSNPQQGFNAGESYEAPDELQVINLTTGATAFTGAPASWNNGATDAFSGDQGWWFDFSELTEPGEYVVRDPVNGRQSPAFAIHPHPYRDVQRAAFKMFYYNRCNAPKQAPYAAPNWTDGDNFNHALQDHHCRFIYDPTNAGLEKDLSGGWFDAGDYNKYVTFTHAAIHNLLAAYETHPDQFGDDWNIPESGNGRPDLLDELKWELDWMVKMINPDGSVHIKMGSRNHSENASSPPSVNDDPRYYGPTCSSASATVASTFAHAALVYAQVPGWEAYAQTLADWATTTFAYVRPLAVAEALQTDCDDGSIVAGDADRTESEQIEILVDAAIYLYELTGEDVYHQFLLAHAAGTEPLNNGFWGPYKLALQDALLRYTTLPEANTELRDLVLTKVSTAVTNNWNGYFGFNEDALYRDYMPTWSYHWGSNSVKAGYGCLNFLLARHGIANDADNQRAMGEELLHGFHGLNPLGLVYLSNMYNFGAEHSANEIYHIWFNDQTDYDHALDSPKGPAPGYLVGGPNKDFSPSQPSPPAGQPPAKSYADWNTGWPENSWEVTEPAIYYQAVYLRLLTEVIGLRGYPDVPSAANEQPEAADRPALFPNPASRHFQLDAPPGPYRLEVRDATGRLLRLYEEVRAGERLSVGNWPGGRYEVLITRLTDGRRWSKPLVLLHQP